MSAYPSGHAVPLGKRLLEALNGDAPDLQAIEKLIAAGASLEETDAQKRTPLHIACTLSQGLEAARLLLAAGANPQALDGNNATPLIMAVLMKDGDMVDLLTAHGAALDNVRFKDMTPLMWAAHLGTRSIVGRLLAAGADAELTTAKGQDAAAFAAHNGKLHIQRDIQEHIRNRKAAKAAFDAAVTTGMPLEQDIAPIRLPALKRRRAAGGASP